LSNKLLAFVNCFTDSPHQHVVQAMESYLAFAADAYHWNMLPDNESVLERGRSGDFDESCVYINGYPVELNMGGGIGFYYSGYSSSNDPMLFQSAIGQLLFRKDGFASLYVGEEGGCLVAKEFILEGNQLEINCRSVGPKAFMLAEIVEFNGTSANPVEGFTWDDCDPIAVNADRYIVKWRGQSNLESLRGKRIYQRDFRGRACPLRPVGGSFRAQPGHRI
jgi:hypothetical protein